MGASTATLQSVAEALGVTISYLLGESAGERPGSALKTRARGEILGRTRRPGLFRQGRATGLGARGHRRRMGGAALDAPAQTDEQDRVRAAADRGAGGIGRRVKRCHRWPTIFPTRCARP